MADGKSLCVTCTGALNDRASSHLRQAVLGKGPNIYEDPNGIIFCADHRLISCNTCMMDFTMPNLFKSESNKLGRGLTDEEAGAVSSAYFAQLHGDEKRGRTGGANPNLCILDHMTVCPRTGRILKCPCKTVTYCSVACQKFHWRLHKLTCPVSKKGRASPDAIAKELGAYLAETDNLVRR